MIGNRVYGPLMRFKIIINPIPHGGCGRNFPPYQEIACLYVFPPEPTPFPGTGGLLSIHFFQNITFVPLIFLVFH